MRSWGGGEGLYVLKINCLQLRFVEKLSVKFERVGEKEEGGSKIILDPLRLRSHYSLRSEGGLDVLKGVPPQLLPPPLL